MSIHKLDKLYKAIPAFTCKPGCNDCCGPVPMAKEEWQAIKMVKRSDNGCIDCAYVVDGACGVYADRPFLCRLFGASLEPKMVCPHGCGPAKPLTVKQTAILTQKYMKLIGVEPAAYTVDFQRPAYRL